MILTDSITIDDAAVKETREGFLTASARVARVGTQRYLARELGPLFADRDPNSVVVVHRPESSVFDKNSVRSFSAIDLTLDHPSEPVDSRNWKQHAVGSTGESALRDGEYLALPLILKDADAIDAWRNGKRELSVGYSCDIIAQDGIAEDGTPYEAVQTNIVANHLAIVGKARGGPSLKFGDHQHGGSRVEVKTKIITFDGLPVDVTDAAEAVINKQASQIKSLTDAAAEAATAAGVAAATIATKDGEIAALTAKLADAEVTPEKLAALVEARAAVIDQAKAILGDSASFDGKSEAEIKKAAVAHKLGDAAASMSDDAINGAFSVLTKDAAIDPVAKGIGKIANVSDAAKASSDAFTKANADMNAWRTQGAA